MLLKRVFNTKSLNKAAKENPTRIPHEKKKQMRFSSQSKSVTFQFTVYVLFAVYSFLFVIIIIIMIGMTLISINSFSTKYISFKYNAIAIHVYCVGVR
jgi:flagellar biosynthesis protein FlhB